MRRNLIKETLCNMKRSMLFTVIIATCTFSLLYGSEKSTVEIPTNELPMYGGIERSHVEKQADEEFIKSAIEQFGSKEKALKNCLSFAWGYYNNKHDPKTAMKRFNQAWLLDPNSAEAFYGFGFLTAVEGDSDMAIELYKRSLELDPTGFAVMWGLAREYKNKAYTILAENRKNEMRKAWGYLDKAFKLYEKASKLAKLNTDLGFIYYQWAVAIELSGNYVEAWEKINLARKYDSSFIESRFIDELSRFMPESKAKLGAVSATSLNLDERLFLTLKADKVNINVNDEVTISVKLYENELNLSCLQLPSLVRNEMSNVSFNEPNQGKEEIDGLIYSTYEFKTKILGIKPGTYHVGPAIITFYITIDESDSKKIYETNFVELRTQDINVVVNQ